MDWKCSEKEESWPFKAVSRLSPVVIKHKREKTSVALPLSSAASSESDKKTMVLSDIIVFVSPFYR